MDRLKRVPALAGGLLLVIGHATVAAGQGARESVRSRCEASGPAAAACVESALAVEAIGAAVGLSFTGGNEFPGSASTLGRRFGTTPRVAAIVRAGILEMDTPGRAGTGEWTGKRSAWIPSFQGALAVNVFDGFRPRPTVGGVLGVDVMGTAGVSLLPGGGGFDGATTAFGYGIRVGVVRESFSLPGITISAVRRHGGDVEWSGSEGSAPDVVLDGPTTTSLRATVGREFLALGIQGGVGWDRVTSDVHVDLAANGGGLLEADGVDTDRTLLFGGVTATWLVVQLHGEAVYASGFDGRPDEFPGGFDPTAGSLMGTLTFRILF